MLAIATSLFAVSAFAAQHCWTSPTGWVDTDGDDCAKYARYGWCHKSWQRYYAVGGKTADQACCECGGGFKHNVHRNCKLPNGQQMTSNLQKVGCTWYLCSTSGTVYAGSSSCRRRSGAAGAASGTTSGPETEGSEDAIGAVMHQLALEYERLDELEHIYDDAVEDLSAHLEAGSFEKTSALQDAEEEAEAKLEEVKEVVGDLEAQLEKLTAAEDALVDLPSLRRF